MSVILVTSPETNAGKTALAVAIGQRLRRLGKRVAYRRLPGDGAIADATFVAGALRQSESPDRLVVTLEKLQDSLRVEADVILVETDSTNPLASATAAVASSAIPLIVARYQPADLAEATIRHALAIGVSTARVVVNAVPDKGLRQVEQSVVPALQQAGMTVVGIIPQDRILLGMTAGELGRALGAEVIAGAEGLDAPVEAVMIAAMSDEGAEQYFRRLNRKVVVAAGDRPDVHMPALATDTSCIVLTEGRDPDPTVFKTADQQGIPLLKVEPDTTAMLDRISEAMAQTRFRQNHKVSRALALYQAHVDEAALLAGVTGEAGAEPEVVR
ncbi:MAG TPA: DRTGG domain-containing protein [Chloroflexota bacterium]|nr:DRTGG domain-containing protein [Chloroflexota bacterium]